MRTRTSFGRSCWMYVCLAPTAMPFACAESVGSRDASVSNRDAGGDVMPIDVPGVDGPSDVNPFQDVASLQCALAGEPDPPMYTAHCDSFDWGACRRWAQDPQQGYAAPDATVYTACQINAAVLDSGYPTGCVRAEHCSGGGFMSAPPCYCGTGPACGPGQLCIRDTPSDTPHCECIVHS